MSAPTHPTDSQGPETVRSGDAPVMPPTVGYAAGARIGGGPALPPREFGDYELLQEIARGGMGVVYRARQRSLNRLVALKMIVSGSVAGPEDIQRFRTEAEAAAALEHPNIVPIYEIGEQEGRPYFSMKLIEGGSLADHVKSLLDRPRESARILAETARAVHFAHLRGILHRDLKPANVLLDESGAPHVTDFGLAKRTGMEKGLTETGAIVGTPDYMAPEQAAGQTRNLTTAVDVYGLGAILYDLLTGHAPFEGDSVLEVLERVRHDDPSAPRSFRKGIDPDLETICLKCLEKEPDKRFASAQALADDLQRWLDGAPIHARPVTTVERARKWVRRRPAVAALGAIVLLVAALGLAGILMEWRQAKLQRGIAESQRQQAEELGARAHAAWEEADRRGEELRCALYATDMQFARAAWDLGDLGRMRRLLDAHRPVEGKTDLRGFEWHYLRRLAEGGRREVRGFQTGGIAFSPDGKSLALTATGGRVLLVDVATGAELRAWAVSGLGKDRHAVGLAWEPSGAGWQVVLRKPRTRQVPEMIASALLGGGEPSLKPLLGVLETAMLPSDGGTVVVADISDPRSLHAPFSIEPDGGAGVLTFRDGMFVPYCAAPSPEGGRIVFGGIGFAFDPQMLARQGPRAQQRLEPEQRAAMLVWDLASDRPQFVREEHMGVLTAVAWSPDGRTIARAGTNAKLTLWNVDTGKISLAIETGLRVNSLAFSHDGNCLAGGKSDGTVALWDAESGRERATFRGHAMAVGAVAFAPDGATLASAAAEEGVVHLRDPGSVQGPRTVAWTTATIPQCAVLAGDGLVLVDREGTVTVSAMTTGRERSRFRVRIAKDEWQIVLSRDGRSLACRASGAELQVWDVELGKPRCTIGDLVPAKMVILEISPDGTCLAASELDPQRGAARVRLWDACTGQPRCTLDGAEAVNRMRFSPSGDTLAGYINRAQGGWELALWDATTGHRRAVGTGGIPTVTGTGNGIAGVGAIAFSSDGARLAASNPDASQRVQIWDLRSGRELPALGPYSGSILGLEFNGDDTRLAINLHAHLRGAGGARIVDAGSGRELLALDERAEMVYGMAFAPDDRRLVTVSTDQLLRWLDASADLSAKPQCHVKVWDATPLE